MKSTPGMRKVYTNCDKCDREIYYDDNYVAISKNVESALKPISNDHKEVFIRDAELLLTLCSNCGVLLNHDLVNILKKVILEEDLVIKTKEEDLLDKALATIGFKPVNFKCVGTSDGLKHLLVKNERGGSDKEPAIVVDYEKQLNKASIVGKYKMAAHPMTFNAFYMYEDCQSEVVTDYLLEKLSKDQITEIEHFFSSKEVSDREAIEIN
jgi:hypothetical protein